jgi:hypothetical protein
MNAVRAKVAAVILLGGTVIGADCESPGPSPCFSCVGAFANLLLDADVCSNNTAFTAVQSCLCAGPQLQSLGAHCAGCLCKSTPSPSECVQCQSDAMITSCSGPCQSYGLPSSACGQCIFASGPWAHSPACQTVVNTCMGN